VAETDEQIGRRPLSQLIASLPGLFSALISAEIARIKAELAATAKRAGIGVGLLVSGIYLLSIAVIVFIIAAIAGLATVLPFWASALIIGGGLIVLAVLLALIGVSQLSRAKPDFSAVQESISDDLSAIRGERPRHKSEGAADD